MGDAVWLVLAAFGGVALGVFYFGGLWLTLRHLPQSKSPALLAMVSFVGRTLLTLAGMYFVMGGRAHASWQRLVACLVGMIVARVVLVRRLGPAGQARREPMG